MTGILEKNIQHIPFLQESKEKEISKLRRAMKDIKETQIQHLQINKTMCEMKYTLYGIKSRY